MTVPMFVLPFRPAYDSNGRFAPGAQAWFTLHETNTPSPVYVDEARTTPHSNPLVADGLGKFPRAFLDPAIVYRMRVYVKDAEVGVDDPIPDHDYDPYTGQEQGSQGNQGANATVISPTVPTVTLAPGAAAYASSAHLGGGTYQLSLGIPRGAQGLSGALSDGVFGDITVSGGGANLQVTAGSLVQGDFAPFAPFVVLGNPIGSAANPIGIPIGIASPDHMLNVAGGDLLYVRKNTERQYSIFIPATAMKPRQTNGPVFTSWETATNKLNYDWLAFDAAGVEAAQFFFAMPSSWNAGTLTCQPIWTAGGGTPGQQVVWTVAGSCLADGENIDAALGSGVWSQDGLLAPNAVHVGPFTEWFNVASPGDNELMCIQIARLGDHANDTLSVDALLIGVRLKFITSEDSDVA
jgi:hypothetical protein